MRNKVGLVRRDGTYYVRVRVPKLLVKKLGTREIKRSLRTTNKDEANSRLPAARDGIQKQFAAALGTPLTIARAPMEIEVERKQLEKFARAWFEPKWHDIQRWLQKPPPDSFSFDELENKKQGYIDLLITLEGVDEDTYRGYVAEARKLLSGRGYENITEASAETLAGYLLRGRLELTKASLRRYEPRAVLHAPPSDSMFQFVGDVGVPEQDSPRTTRRTGPTLDQAIGRFRNDPNRAHLSSKGSKSYDTAFRVLREMVGDDTLMTAITRDDVKPFPEILATLPPNSTKRFKEMSALQAATHAAENGIAPLKVKTVENILASLSAFFQWAVDEHHIEKHLTNGLKPVQKPQSKAEGRQPFSEENLEAIFSAELFQGGFRSAAAKNSGHYWVPLFALYHGARCNELCQLEVTDIGVNEGTPFFRVTDESTGDVEKHVKTKNAHRTVPIHPVLQDLGFMDYVEEVRAAKHAQLFPDLTKAKTGYFSDNFSKWFSLFRKQQGVTDTRRTFHSFRHTFRKACRAARIPDNVACELCGWSNAEGKPIPDTYNSDLDLVSLAHNAIEIAKIRFPKVESLLLHESGGLP